MENEERNERYLDVRGIILKVLFLLLFVFLLLWLAPFPRKEPVYDALFNENVENMKEAARSYYTLERLPENVGDKTGMTLREMLDMKILLPFIDGNGKECDLDASYVEITRMDTEFVLKVYLECDTKQDYVLEYIGCNDVCLLFNCEDEEEPEEEPETEEITKYFMKKKISSSYWTDWSEWTFTYEAKSSTVDRIERDVYTAKKWVEEGYTEYEYKTTVITQKNSTSYWEEGDWVIGDKDPLPDTSTRKLVDEAVTTTYENPGYRCNYNDFYRSVTVDPEDNVYAMFPTYCPVFKGDVLVGYYVKEKWNLYNRYWYIGDPVKVYKYKYAYLRTEDYPATSEENKIWTTKTDLFEGTTTEIVGDSTVTTKKEYTDTDPKVYEDGHWIYDNPVIYYESISKIKTGWVVNKPFKQYSYKYKKYTSKTLTEWIKEAELNKYLNNGWTKEKTVVQTVEL